jgi:hypothetical protein
LKQISNEHFDDRTKLNFAAVVHKRIISTERPPLVGEFSANLCG